LEEATDTERRIPPGPEESPPPESEKPAVPKSEISSRKPREALNRNNLNTSLYYVIIDSDGSARLQPVIRKVEFVDSPITRTLESLLGGPMPGERERGLISFIPDDTTLISARLQSGHLTLNFSDEFEENYNGREAIHFQLSQVMLTSFEFKQVSTLTILIGGQKKQYITGEGIPLKEVYTKEDLSISHTPG
jgi:spore germination protein GerM